MKIIEWLAVLWCICMVVRGIVFLFSWQPFLGFMVFIPLLGLAWLFCRELGRKDRELAKQGFHVEWVSQGMVRAGPDDVAIVYYDLKGQVWFEGKEVGQNWIISVPALCAWQAKVPDWAKNQRHIIVERIRQSNKRIIINDDQ